MFRTWNEFKSGKIKKQDIAEFSVNLESQIFKLRDDLLSGTYTHSSYKSFYICDPKRRHINKAIPIDRLLHHAIFRVLYPSFDRKFIFDSYSSREEKGIHKAHGRFRKFAWSLSSNNTRIVWVLKCDIRKFFDSIDHGILIKIVSSTIHDERTINLLKEIIGSYRTKEGKGIPLGNLTSQLFSNVYLDVFDQFVKRELRIKHYIRYADDFVILDRDKEALETLLPRLADFLGKELKLAIHPNKIIIRKYSAGIDFLGYVIFPNHLVLRTKTKNRILKKVEVLKAQLKSDAITQSSFDQSIASYLGLLKHCRGKQIARQIDGDEAVACG